MSTHFQTALSLHKAGRLPEAYAEYVKALDLEPGRGDIKYLLGTLLYQTGNIAPARAMLTEAVEQQPENVSALNSLGLCYQAVGDFVSAIHYFNNALEVDINNINVLNNLGTSLSALNRHLEAAAAFKRAVVLSPEDTGSLFNLALSLMQMKSYTEAEQVLTQIITVAPGTAAAINTLGLLYTETNRFEEAEEAFKMLLEAEPGHSDGLFNYSRLLMKIKKYPAAAEKLKQLMQGAPDNHEIILLYAGCKFELTDFAEAFPLYRKLVAEATDERIYKEALQKLAFGLQRVGALSEAAALYNNILNKYPDDIFSLHNFAMMRLSEAKTDECIGLFERILAIQPGNAEALINLSVALTEKNPERAEQCLRSALVTDSDNADALYNLGNICSATGRIEEAEQLFLKAIEKNAFLYKAYNNLGVVYQQSNRYAEAEKILVKGLLYAPQSTELMNNFGNVFRLQGKVDEALQWFNKALEINPRFYEACKNKGMTLLLAGDYKEGWKWYNYRWALDMQMRKYSKPQWTGEYYEGIRLFVYAEQGLGDTLQFIRYLPLLAMNGITILLETQPELIGLFSGLPYIHKLYAKGEDTVEENEFDFYIPLLNIPGVVQPRLSQVPPADKQLTIPSEIKSKWRALISNDKPAVGVVWKGNPGHKNDKNRSIPRDIFDTLYEETRCNFYQLQYGNTETTSAPNVINCAPHIKNFEDTAAALECVDLLITVDTSVAHLAGTLTKPLWLLVAMAPDWRWGLEKNTTVWYPSATIYRQREAGNWSDVILSVKNNLKKILESH